MKLAAVQIQSQPGRTEANLAHGSDFFNAFVLAGPDGEVAGRACKSNAEANAFRRGRHQHVIDTPIGPIGIGICAGNQFTAQLWLAARRTVRYRRRPGGMRHTGPGPQALPRAAKLRRLAVAGPALSRKAVIPDDILTGRLCCAMSRERKRKAQRKGGVR